jgi:hypothetical protein
MAAVPPPERLVSEERVPDETVIWRYMPFQRFVNILETHKLWFSRPFKFDDRWEGLFPPSYLRRTRQYASENGVSFECFDRDFRRRLRRHRYAHFINCWHMGEHESDGMWRLYAKDQKGEDQKAVAIRSTVGDATDCLRPHGAGQVIYYDPAHDIRSPTIFGAHDILFKREAFRWEGEFRFWFDDDELMARIEIGQEIDEATLTPGMLVHFDMAKFIQRIVVAPGSPDEFIDEVREVCARLKMTRLWRLIDRSYSDRMWDEFTR